MSSPNVTRRKLQKKSKRKRRKRCRFCKGRASCRPPIRNQQGKWQLTKKCSENQCGQVEVLTLYGKRTGV